MRNFVYVLYIMSYGIGIIDIGHSKLIDGIDRYNEPIKEVADLNNNIYTYPVAEPEVPSSNLMYIGIGAAVVVAIALLR